LKTGAFCFGDDRFLGDAVIFAVAVFVDDADERVSF
jgi:hypothetical protein